ncbi:hypothetical protein JZU71_04800, partial [bacterium]|nr:hypothetical protein [bacterium]
TQIRDNNIVLSGDETMVVTTTKYMLRLSKAYIDWLFTGTYTSDITRPDYSATMSGKFIVFDAESLTNVGLQTRLNQGQGFGTFSLPGEAALKANVLTARDRVQPFDFWMMREKLGVVIPRPQQLTIILERQ